MKAYIDGSSLGIYGYLLSDGTKKIFRDYNLTNNQAEWLSLLTLLIDLKPNTNVTIYTDSSIVANQFNKNWTTVNRTLKHLKEICYQVIKIKGLSVNVIWIPRKENKFGEILDRILNRERRKRQKLRVRLGRGYL